MSGRRLLAALLSHLCLWTAARPSEPNGEHATATVTTLVLIKSHAPTRLMLKRWCALAAEVAALPSYTLVFALEGEHANQTSVLRHRFETFLCPDASPAFKRLDLFELVEDEFFERHPFRSEHVAAVVGAARKYPVREYLKILLELAFFDRYRSRYTFDHLWAFEQDVAWSGSLLSIMLRMEGAKEDMLCHNLAMIDAAVVDHQWRWSNAHSGWAGTAAGAPAGTTAHVYRLRCSKFAQRLSLRLLTALVDDYIAIGAWAQDEWFAPTVCDMHVGRSWDPPCLVGQIPYKCIGPVFSCCQPPVNVSQWAHLLADAGTSSLLFHRVKL